MYNYKVKEPIRRPNRKYNKLIASIVKGNLDVIPYTDKVNAYNKRVKQAPCGFATIMRIIDKHYTIYD